MEAGPTSQHCKENHPSRCLSWCVILLRSWLVSNLTLQGYFIPEGTIVMPNVTAIAEDDISGLSTEVFAPERFLLKNKAIDPGSYAFGFGRRLGTVSMNQFRI
jgi:cytochrome P450